MYIETYKIDVIVFISIKRHNICDVTLTDIFQFQSVDTDDITL